ncbi:MAG: protein kinase domain-containing protein [Desertimonas sp.]
MGTAPRRPGDTPDASILTAVPRRPDRSRRADQATFVQIDGYDHLEPIGRGGFSHVYSARQRDFNRRVAIKVLTFGLADEREQRSFERECRAMGLVSQHPHIVTVFNSAFTSTDQPCIVMELYSGGTMIDRQRREGQLGVGTVLDAGVKIAGALQTAHDRGLLHRDIKPQNLFISEFGEPALGDFGISTLDDERSISGSGGLTVHYAPPEVLEGAVATATSDVYSLAATLYTLLEGVRPFTGGPDRRQTVGELARRIMLEAPPRSSRADVPRSLADLLVATMAKEPSDRPLTAAAFGRELQRVQAEMGLPVTTLPVASPGGPVVRPGAGPAWPSPAAATPPEAGVPPAPPPSSPVDEAASLGPGVAPVVQMRFTDEPGDHDTHTVTVGRPRPGAEGSSEDSSGRPGGPGEVAPTTRRIVFGTIAGVVSLSAIAGALLLFADGGDSPDRPATTLDASIPEAPSIRPPAPTGVTAVVTDRTIRVSWNGPPEGVDVDHYTVDPMTEILDPIDVTAGELVAEFTLEIDVPERICFEVLAVAADGDLSERSQPACT